jgi:L-malate glycosyltransferase
MKDKPRILILENAIDVTGGFTSVLRSSILLRDKFDFLFVIPRNSKTAAVLNSHQFEWTELPMRELSRRWTAALLYLPVLLLNTLRFSSIVRIKKIDIINCNDFYNLIPAVYTMLRGKVPFVCYVRFLPSKFPSFLVKVWFSLNNRLGTCIIAVSETVKRELPVSSKVVVVGNELPPEKAGTSSVQTLTVLYPANYIQGKGQEHALEAFSRIYLKYPDWKLRFVGGDMGLTKNKNFKEKLMRLGESLGLSGHVLWEGFSEDMAQEYSRAELVLNFSDSESFSMTCLEAMNYSRPVIATACGGPSELIDHGINGLLVPVGSVDEMTSALNLLLSDSSMRRKLGKAAAKKVHEKYSYRNTVGALEQIYLSVSASIHTT